jgi:hypothetical protein
MVLPSIRGGTFPLTAASSRHLKELYHGRNVTLVLWLNSSSTMSWMWWKTGNALEPRNHAGPQLKCTQPACLYAHIYPYVTRMLLACRHFLGETKKVPVIIQNTWTHEAWSKRCKFHVSYFESQGPPRQPNFAETPNTRTNSNGINEKVERPPLVRVNWGGTLFHSDRPWTILHLCVSPPRDV